ncbi:MAG: GlcG/HbpS family heme-binding protein [Bryobacteraceae bacterium]
MKSDFIRYAGILLSCLLISAMAVSAQLATRRSLTLEAAKQIAAAAEAEARKNQWNVVIAIVDEGGNLVYLQKMDDTQTGSIEVAQRKARSAALFRRPTKVFEDGLAGGRHAILSLPGAMPVEGGIPITVDGKVIGGIGVSGVTSQQDAQIATAGLRVVEKMK